MKNSKKIIVFILLLGVFAGSLNAQDQKENNFYLSPYLGLTCPLGDFNFLNENGISSVVSLNVEHKRTDYRFNSIDNLITFSNK